MEDARSDPTGIALVSVNLSFKLFRALDAAGWLALHPPHAVVSSTNACSSPPKHARDASCMCLVRNHQLTVADVRTAHLMAAVLRV
jgi:hypothetical protein